MKRFQGLIFDFNGVLLLDIETHVNTWTRIAQEIRGTGLSREEFEQHINGRTNMSAFEYLFGRSLQTEELERWMTKKELAYQAAANEQGDSYQFAPGTAGLFQRLVKRGIPYTIATSSPTMNIAYYNKKLHLDQWFDMSKIAYDDGTMQGKPAPDLYLRAAQLLSLKPEDCVVIEDASSGIAAAHAAGIGHIIAIGPKDLHASLRKIPDVDEVIENLDEIDVSRLF